MQAGMVSGDGVERVQPGEVTDVVLRDALIVPDHSGPRRLRHDIEDPARFLDRQLDQLVIGQCQHGRVGGTAPNTRRSSASDESVVATE